MAQQIGDDDIGTPQTRSAAPPDMTGGYAVDVRRSGKAVQIILTSASEYASIEMYDSLIRSLEKGCLRLEVKFNRP